jgi:hypothetical protein
MKCVERSNCGSSIHFCYIFSSAELKLGTYLSLYRCQTDANQLIIYLNIQLQCLKKQIGAIW